MTSTKELLALNEQIVGLRRTGTSVSLGLPANPDKLETELHQITSELSSRLSVEDGADEGQASANLDARLLDSESLPQPYQQTIEAGLREGRLAAAFEGLTESAQIADGLRRNTWAGLAYPALVVFMAFLMLAFLAARVLFTFDSAHDSLRLPKSIWTQWSAFVGSAGWIWLLVPLVLLLAVLFFRRLRHRWGRNDTYVRVPSWLPGFRRFGRDLRLADFAETMCQLRRQGIERDQAMALASATSGHRLNFDPVSKQLSEASVPPLLRWALFSAGRNADSDDPEAPAVNTELQSLQMAASVYRQRAVEKSRLVSKVVPIVACIFVGGTVVFFYALTVWAPLVTLIQSLCSDDAILGRF